MIGVLNEIFFLFIYICLFLCLFSGKGGPIDTKLHPHVSLARRRPFFARPGARPCDPPPREHRYCLRCASPGCGGASRPRPRGWKRRYLFKANCAQRQPIHWILATRPRDRGRRGLRSVHCEPTLSSLPQPKKVPGCASRLPGSPFAATEKHPAQGV